MPFLTVNVVLAVFAPVMVAALGNRNAPVKVFDTPDRHGSMSFVSMATMRSSKSTISVAAAAGCVLVHGR